MCAVAVPKLQTLRQALRHAIFDNTETIHLGEARQSTTSTQVAPASRCATLLVTNADAYASLVSKCPNQQTFLSLLRLVQEHRGPVHAPSSRQIGNANPPRDPVTAVGSHQVERNPAQGVGIVKLRKHRMRQFIRTAGRNWPAKEHPSRCRKRASFIKIAAANGFSKNPRRKVALLRAFGRAGPPHP